MSLSVPSNPFPNGTGFSAIGFTILMLFVGAVGGLVIYGIKLLGEMM